MQDTGTYKPRYGAIANWLVCTLLHHQPRYKQVEWEGLLFLILDPIIKHVTDLIPDYYVI